MSEGGETRSGAGGLVRRIEGPAGPDGWRIARVTGVLPGSVAIDVEGPDGASLRLVLAQRGTQSLVETRHGSLSYQRPQGLDDLKAVEVARHFGKLLDGDELPLTTLFPHLAFHRVREADEGSRVRALLGPALKGLLPAPSSGSSPRSLFFDPPGLAEFLAPDLVLGGAPVAGFVLRSITLPSTGNRASHDFGVFLLEFTGSEGTPRESSVRLAVSADGDSGAFGEAGPLTVRIVGHDGDPESLPAAWCSVASWVLAILRLRWADGATLVRPSSLSELRALSVPAGSGKAPSQGVNAPVQVVRREDAALNLAIDAECGQSCVFCSVKRYVKPFDGGEAQRDTLVGQLRRASERGVRALRLNGIDPLSFSGVLDVLGAARELGFTTVDIYSPGHRLTDEAFRRELLRRAPVRTSVWLPIYGTTAEVHDTVTGRPGAYVSVMRALEGWLADAPPDSLVVTTVAVRQNASQLPALLAWASARNLRIDLKAPYPMRQAADDPYAASVMRETDLLAQWLSDPSVVGESRVPTPANKFDRIPFLLGALPHPCVPFAAEVERDLGLFGRLPRGSSPRLPGTEYRAVDFQHADGAGASDAFSVATVPCPKAAACALAPICPREFYAVYAEKFGLDEFVPVSPHRLYTLRPHASVGRGPVV